MPSNISQRESAADTETSDLGPHLDRDGSGKTIGAGGNTKPLVTASAAAMLTADKTSTASEPEGNGEHVETYDTNATKSEKSNQNQDGGLQIPEGGNGSTRRPVETSIWDWDTPLKSVGESSSYYYEPQGELVEEQRDHRPSWMEFCIPHAVSGSGMNWPFQRAHGSNISDGFAVPRRPTGNVPATAGVKRKSVSDQSPTASRHSERRTSHAISDSGEEPLSASDLRPPAHSTRSQGGPMTRGRSATETADTGQRPHRMNAESLRPPLSIEGAAGGSRRTLTDPGMPMVLPARKVFPIQIGDKLFRLSGASISSDAPSYFSQFFEEQLRRNEGADNVRTLYIDRDPATFEDISLHLQGYHIEPRDGPHFVKLFADAQFFSLPRLTAQLFSSAIYIRVGESEFQIPRDLFSSPGDSPNYFSLGFSAFFTTPSEVFPGLSQRSLLRPPSILPPSVPNRSAKTFADLLHILKGYPVEIRSEEHRAELLRDARYFHLKGLEQRLIPHQISYNLARKRSEILIRLEDIRQSGVSFAADVATGNISAAASPASRTTTSSIPTGPGWVYYQRPYVDSDAYSLILEISGEEHTFLSIEPGSSPLRARMGRGVFHKQTLSRVTSLFSVIANKMNLPVTQPLGLMMMERGAGVASLPVSPHNTGVSDERVKVRIGADADVTVDGKKWLAGEDADDYDESAMDVDPTNSSGSRSRKRRKPQEDEDDGEEWIVRKAQWRLRVQPMNGGIQSGRSGMEVILGAVKIEAYSSERGRNSLREFLT